MMKITGRREKTGAKLGGSLPIDAANLAPVATQQAS
jgi:hypothetical protein